MNRYILKKIDLINEDEYVCLESHCANIATMVLTKENNQKNKELGVYCNFHSSINQQYYEWKEHFAWMNLLIWIPVLWSLIYLPLIALGKNKIRKNSQKAYKRDKHGNFFGSTINISRGKNDSKNRNSKVADVKFKNKLKTIKSSERLFKASLALAIVIFSLFVIIDIIDIIIFISGTHLIGSVGYVFYQLFLIITYLTYLVLAIRVCLSKKRSLAILNLVLSIVILCFTPLLYIGIGIIGWFAFAQIIIYSKIIKNKK